MKNRFFHEFTKGQTAQFLKETRNLSFEAFSTFELTKIEDVPIDKIRIVDGHAILTQGEEQYLMFRYKKYYYTRWSIVRSFPKYHPVECETLETYSGFAFANKMPVDIYSRDENGKVFENIYLDLCKRCSRLLFKSIWGTNHSWYESVLKFVEDNKDCVMQSNGYHPMWSQVTEAYREKMGWCCEDSKCRIDLAKPEDHQYLHTHHENGKKNDNRESNFEALCILCHALEHEDRLREKNGFEQVDEFIEKHRSRLDKEKLARYEQIRETR